MLCFDLLSGMQPASRSLNLWKKMLECCVHLLSYFWYITTSEKLPEVATTLPNHFGMGDNLAVLQFFLLQIFLSLANLWFIRFQEQFAIVRKRSWSNLYLLIRPPRRPLVVGRGSILIPGFIRSPPTLTVYDVTHPLPLRECR